MKIPYVYYNPKFCETQNIRGAYKVVGFLSVLQKLKILDFTYAIRQTRVSTPWTSKDSQLQTLNSHIFQYNIPMKHDVFIFRDDLWKWCLRRENQKTRPSGVSKGIVATQTYWKAEPFLFVLKKLKVIRYSWENYLDLYFQKKHRTIVNNLRVYAVLPMFYGSWR